MAAFKPEDLVKARAGYVEYPGGPLCGNCEYADTKKKWCVKFDFAISLRNGCCDYWESADKRGKDWKEMLRSGRNYVEVEKLMIALPSREDGGPLAQYFGPEEE